MNYKRAAYNWGQAAGRAVVYGSLGCTVGVLPGTRPVTQWCMHRWCSGSADGLKINRRLVDGHKLQQTGQAILVANHLSTLDILILGSFLRRDYRWLAKAPLFNVPFMGWYLRIAGHIPVHRGVDAQDRNRQIAAQINGVVDEGASVLFFPEGTRSDTGDLKPFRMGAFLAAAREELPIIPLVIRGTHELMVKNAPDLAIHTDRECSVKVLDPILPSESLGDDVVVRAEGLRDLAFDAIFQDLEYGSV